MKNREEFADIMFKIVVAICGIVAVIGFMFSTYWDNRYVMNGTVIAESAELRTIEDPSGNMWNIEDTNFEIGDEVVLTMNINKTKTYIYDDIIEKIEKR